MPRIIEYRTEKEWLELRRDCITSSDISALFGENPYCTEFELWHRKKSGTEVVYEDDDRKKWGRRLEAPIADGIAEDNGWTVRPLKVFMTHSEFPRYGSSFDYEVRRGNEKGLLELKNVDMRQFKQKWLVDGDEIEAPVSIEIQAQSELEVANSNNPEPYTFVVIGALIGGNKPIVIEREWDREMGRLLLSRAKSFWHNIDHDIEPLPDFTRDGEIIKLLYAGVNGETVDMSSNNRLASLIADYPALTAAEKAAKEAREAAKTEIASIVGNASLAKCGSAYITRKTVSRKAFSVAESSYVKMDIKQPKEKGTSQ